MKTDPGPAIVAAARRMLGTPFRHQGRQPGVGVDCAGFIVLAHRGAGIAPRDVEGYRAFPRVEDVRRALEASGRRVVTPQAGDVLAISLEHRPERIRHLGLMSSDTNWIHIENGGRLTESPLPAAVRQRAEFWRLRGDAWQRQ